MPAYSTAAGVVTSSNGTGPGREMSLNYREDHYDGIIVDPLGLPESAESFQRALQTSLKVKNGIIPIFQPCAFASFPGLKGVSRVILAICLGESHLSLLGLSPMI